MNGPNGLGRDTQTGVHIERGLCIVPYDMTLVGHKCFLEGPGGLGTPVFGTETRQRFQRGS